MLLILKFFAPCHASKEVVALDFHSWYKVKVQRFKQFATGTKMQLFKLLSCRHLSLTENEKIKYKI